MPIDTPLELNLVSGLIILMLKVKKRIQAVNQKVSSAKFDKRAIVKTGCESWQIDTARKNTVAYSTFLFVAVGIRTKFLPHCL